MKSDSILEKYKRTKFAALAVTWTVAILHIEADPRAYFLGACAVTIGYLVMQGLIDLEDRRGK